MMKLVRGILVLAGTTLVGCGASDAELNSEPLGSAASPLQSCGMASATSYESYAEARQLAAENIAGLCASHGGVSRIWPCLTNADAPPHLADCRYCCNQ